MKIHLPLITLLLAAAFSGCTSQSEKKEPIIQSIDFEPIAAVPDVGVPIDLLMKDDTIFISDYYGDSLLHRYVLPQAEKLSSKVPRGAGPGELIPPIGAIIHGDTLLAYSRPIMTLFKGNLYSKERLRSVGMPPTMVSNLYAAGNGDIIASVIAFSVDEDNKEYRYALLDDNLALKYMFGEYPSCTAGEMSDIDARSMFHQTQNILPVDEKAFVAIGAYDMSFYELGADGKYVLKKTVIVKPYAYSVEKGSEVKTPSTRLQADYDRPISYATIHDGKIILAFKKEKTPSKDPAIYFEVYDMDGNLETRLTPEGTVIAPFGVSPRGEIIAFVEDETGYTLMKSTPIPL